MKRRFTPRMIPHLARTVLACASLAIFILAFTGASRLCLAIARPQFSPLLLAALAGGTGAIAAVAALLAVAFALGRVYCAFVCPFGLVQDAASLLSRSFSRRPPNLPWLRYAVAGIVFGAVAAGSPALLRIIDPYANAGRAVAAFAAGGFIALAAIAAAALFFRRAFCTMLCPVGTLFGLASKASPAGLGIGDGCVHCGLCERRCPTGAVSHAAGAVDNERCVRCMSCVAACPRGAITFGRAAKKRRAAFPAPAGGVDAARRAFIANAAALVAGAAAGVVAAKLGLREKAEKTAVATFHPDTCLAFDGEPCGRCARACPAGAIELRKNGTPKSPDPSKCVGCAACEAACPAKPEKAMRVQLVRRDSE